MSTATARSRKQSFFEACSACRRAALRELPSSMTARSLEATETVVSEVGPEVATAAAKAAGTGPAVPTVVVRVAAPTVVVQAAEHTVVVQVAVPMAEVLIAVVQAAVPTAAVLGVPMVAVPMAAVLVEALMAEMLTAEVPMAVVLVMVPLAAPTAVTHMVAMAPMAQLGLVDPAVLASMAMHPTAGPECSGSPCGGRNTQAGRSSTATCRQPMPPLATQSSPPHRIQTSRWVLIRMSLASPGTTRTCTYRKSAARSRREASSAKGSFRVPTASGWMCPRPNDLQITSPSTTRTRSVSGWSGRQ
mmetsp:Transcript_30138/g.65812  ORF Transcript_30138/g.65812 Transcript_30138/m.65812 type:complete len:303 (-) Transcript_30138:689-1597(-)